MTPARAAIVAGGLATRLGGVPKVLLPIGGKSLLLRHLDAIAAAGIRDVTICAGHRAADLAAAIPHRRDLTIHLAAESTPLGSGGSVGAACAGGGGDLLVIFGDIMAGVDYAPLLAHHRAARADATLVVHPNDHPHDSDLVEADGGGRVVAIHRKPHPPGRRLTNCVAAGVFVLSAAFVDRIGNHGPRDLVHDVLLPALAGGARLAAYDTAEYLKDIGTPERYAAVCAQWP